MTPPCGSASGSTKRCAVRTLSRCALCLPVRWLSCRLELHVDAAELQQRPATGRAPQGPEWAGTGRELFAAFRATVGSADTGASVFPGVTAPGQEVRLVQPV